MPEVKQMIRCDGCRGWFRMDENHVFSRPIFEWPKHWFFMSFHMKSEVIKESFCSWLCTKDYVDRQYAKHHPEDVRMQREVK